MKLSFKEGDWVDFNTWTSEFGVSGQSGINVSNANNVIVCVSRENGDGVPYKDRWYSHAQWDGVCFTGQGLEGDQTLTKANKRLKQDKRAYFFRKKGSLYLEAYIYIAAHSFLLRNVTIQTRAPNYKMILMVIGETFGCSI